MFIIIMALSSESISTLMPFASTLIMFALILSEFASILDIMSESMAGSMLPPPLGRFSIKFDSTAISMALVSKPIIFAVILSEFVLMPVLFVEIAFTLVEMASELASIAPLLS